MSGLTVKLTTGGLASFAKKMQDLAQKEEGMVRLVVAASSLNIRNAAKRRVNRNKAATLAARKEREIAPARDEVAQATEAVTTAKRGQKRQAKAALAAAKKRLKAAEKRAKKIKRRTGNQLALSIRVDFYEDKKTAAVATNAPYAKFVEYGTGVRGSGESASGEDKPPLEDGYQYGPKPGMKARPFLYPSWKDEQGPFKEALEAGMKRVIG